MKDWKKGLVAIAALVLLLPCAALAQTQATLVGSVTDQTGAAIPGAVITVTNLGTALERAVESNAVGQYRVFPLNPGDYSVSAESAGFKTQIRNEVTLQVADVIELGFVMELGDVTETIEVTGAAPIMQTQEASVAGVVREEDLQRLPVNQRNFTRLILLMPGTSSRKRSQSRGTGESGTQLYSVNGGRPQDNNYVLDGIDSNMQMMNSPGISPPMDAIQEFKVATNTGSEFARSAGANVNMAIRSGTSEIHGTAYEFLRNSQLDANEFFFNRNRGPNSPERVPFNLNNYGVAVGGPVPGLSEKMFWFVSWEGFKRRRGSNQTLSTPPLDFRAGDFSRIVNSVTDPVAGAIIDPLTGTPFPNGIIPQSAQNSAMPIAIRITQPDGPNRPGDVNNYIGNRSQTNDKDQLHWRWDYNMDSNDTFFFRFSNQTADLISPQSNPLYNRVGGFHVFNYGGTWSHIFGPTTVMSLTFGTNQPDNPGITKHDTLTRADFLDQTGLQMYQRDVFTDPGVGISIGAYRAGGGGGTGDEVYQLSGNLSLVKGRHNFRFSGQYHRRRFYTNTSNPMNGNAIFNGQLSGFAMADALLGYPSEIRRGQGNTLTNGIGHFLIAAVQDDWRISEKLTVNLGMMYQFGSRPYDTTDRLGNLWVRRDQTTGEYFGTLLWASKNPQPAPADGRVSAASNPADYVTGLSANPGGWGRALVGSDRNDFAPRLGLAYQLDQKTVIRAGFGIFYNSTFVQELQDLRKFWPFTVQQVFSPNRGGIDLSITDAGPPFSSTAALGGWPQQPTNRSPYSMQWNFFIQRQVMDDLTLDIGYVGSGSRKQIGYSPFNNAISPGAGAIGPRRLLPFFGDLDGGWNEFNGSYNGLQVKLLKRFSRGMQFNLNYTWHKALDGQSSLAEVKVQDPFNRRADYSRSSWDVRQVFNFSYVYELPFGKGQRLGGGMSSVADAIVGGWSLEGITRLETGPPVNLRVGRDTSNTGRHRQRPNLVGDPNAGLKTPDNWFNENAFALPAQYTFGTAAPYITDADGIVSFDIALQKQFALTESNSIELRAEFFNIPNHVNFNLPQENMRSGAYNTITSQSTNPRQIQLGLRWRF